MGEQATFLPPRYAMPELIARGGMADVYTATDSALGRAVAIKVLSERCAGDAELRARFTREAHTAAGLSGLPNIVTIYDVGESAGRPHIVMEYLPGGSLADHLRAGSVAPSRALEWLDQAARGLDAAHARGVVHRDVKPGNLLVGADGEVRVTDFGIARAAGHDSLTAIGTVLGTAGYMAPEQALGERATAASDRYSLAAVAFELLTGRRPFARESQTAEAAAHVSAPIPSASSHDGSLPATLDAALAAGLAKAPAERPPSCSALVSDLRRSFREAAPVTAQMTARTAVAGPAAPPPRRRRLPLRALPLALLLAALALAGLGIGSLVSRDTSAGTSAPPRETRTGGQTQAASRSGQRTGPATTSGGSQTPAGGQAAGQGGGQGGQGAAGDGRGRQGTRQAHGGGPAASASGAALNDAGYRRMLAGDFGGALPLLERAFSRLQGTRTLAEAYASYNLALTRLALGSCDGVSDLIQHSQTIQGSRPELDRLRRETGRRCGNGNGDGGD